MANVIVTEAALGGVADHIRAKGGTSAQLTWPGGFEAAIDAITPQFEEGDAGKVVVSDGSGGYELEAQTSTAFTDNGTYTTTTNNSVTVNIPAAAGNRY